jgi:hypothetical protein
MSILLLDHHESICTKRVAKQAEWAMAENRHTKWLREYKEAQSGNSKEVDGGSGEGGGK